MIIIVNDQKVLNIIIELSKFLDLREDVITNEYNKFIKRLITNEYSDALFKLGKITENIIKHSVNKLLSHNICTEKVSFYKCLNIFEEKINSFSRDKIDKKMLINLLNTFKSAYYIIYVKRNIEGHDIGSHIYINSSDTLIAYLFFIYLLMYLLNIFYHIELDELKDVMNYIVLSEIKMDQNADRAFAYSLIISSNTYGYNEIPRRKISDIMRSRYGFSESTITRLISKFKKKKLILYNSKKKTIIIPEVNYIKLINLALGGDIND